MTPETCINRPKPKSAIDEGDRGDRRILLQKKRTATLYANMLERKRDDVVRLLFSHEVPIPISSVFVTSTLMSFGLRNNIQLLNRIAWIAVLKGSPR